MKENSNFSKLYIIFQAVMLLVAVLNFFINL